MKKLFRKLNKNILRLNKFLILLTLILFISITFIYSCKRETKSNKIIYTSIEPIKYLIDFISGNKLETKTLVNKNFDPHTFEITPKEIELLNNSFSYLSLNLPFEKIITEKIMKINPEFKIIDISKNINFIEALHHHHENHEEEHKHENENEQSNQNKENKKEFEEFDIHLWVSLYNLKIISKNIYEFIIGNFPELKENAEKNYIELINKFDIYIEKFNSIIKEKNIKNILVYHPSFTYFCKDFNLVQIVLEIEGKEPTIKNIKSFFDSVKEKNIKVFYTTPQFPTSYSDLLKKELNIEIFELNILIYNIFEIFDNLYLSFEKYY